MSLRVNHLLPLLIMLFLAGMTLWLRQTIELAPVAERNNSNADPDAMVENLKLTRLGANGKSQYSMSARRMLHFPGNDSTQLEEPRFNRRGEDGIALTITANRGTVTRNADEAFFYGNVLLRRDAAAGLPELQARTEYLHILAAKDMARTDQHVTISEGGRVVSGVGMETNKLTRQFSLKSQVKGHYDVARRN